MHGARVSTRYLERVIFEAVQSDTDTHDGGTHWHNESGNAHLIVSKFRAKNDQSEVRFIIPL